MWNSPLCSTDRGHEYKFVLEDFLNMREHAAPDAIWLFDDQCNVTACGSAHAGHSDLFASGPALAVCDLVGSGLLELVDSYYVGKRQWARYAAPAGAAARGEIRRHNGTCASASGPEGEHGRWCRRANTVHLPCSPRCNITWASPHLQAYWESTNRTNRERREQSAVHERSCN